MRGVEWRAWHDCSSGPGRAMPATPVTPVNIYQALCLALHCEFSSIRLVQLMLNSSKYNTRHILQYLLVI